MILISLFAFFKSFSLRCNRPNAKKLAFEGIFCLVFLLSYSVQAQLKNKSSFKIVPLGIKGGLDESNLSAYMIAPAGTNNYICADAGTIRFGIDKAIANKVFKADAATVLKSYIKGYMISHAHLDHVSGLIINSPDDTAKKIYAMPYVINTFKEKYFTWQNWANLGNEGEKPLLNKYQYATLSPEVEFEVENTGMTATPFVLSHGNPYESTGFLLNNKGNFLLYLGDTGADTLERSDKLRTLWNYITPLIKNGKLKGIFIEVSFPDEQPDKQLFGHFTPRWLMHEMAVLNKLTGSAALNKVSIVITHEKPSGNSEKAIKEQLKRRNKLGLKLLYPMQGFMFQL